MRLTNPRNPGLLVVAGGVLLGVALLVLANAVTGQHARGHWVQPARQLGALLLLGGVYVGVWVMLARRKRR